MTLLLFAQNSTSEELNKKSLETKFGFYGGYQMNQHLIGFDSLPGLQTCCPKHKDGSGSGVYLGISYEFQLPSNLSTGFRLGASTLDGESLGTDDTSLVVVSDQLVTGSSRHTLKTELIDFGIEPYLTYRTPIGLDVTLGGRLSMWMLNRYTYLEQLEKPENRGVYKSTGTRDRNYRAADLEEMSGVYGAILGRIDYDFILTEDSSFTIAPEVSYYMGMTDIVTNHDWKINSIKFGLAINYLFKEKQKIYETEERTVFNIDTVTVESYDIAEDRIIGGYPDISKTIDTTFTKILIVETTTRTDTLYTRPAPVAKITPSHDEININVQFLTESFPVIPVVFFDINESELPARYRNTTDKKDFSFSKIKPNAMELHYHTLDIIGYRMTENPSTNITINGYSDKTTENANCDLASERAISLKNYLVNQWGIHENRITLKVNEIDCSPSRTADTPGEDSYAENRRAEITSNSFELIEPVVRKQLLEVNSYYPQRITFSTEGSTEKGVKKWFMQSQYDGRNFIDLEIGAVDGIELDIDDEIIDKLKVESPIHMKFEMADLNGKKASATSSIDIRIDTSNYELSRLAMLNFDIASARISEADRVFFREFIKYINDSSIVRIIGFSDRIGGEKFNQKLSEKRAENVADLLLSIKPNAQIREIKGVGASEFSPGVNSFNTPIERYLSRTVYIEIINKLN